LIRWRVRLEDGETVGDVLRRAEVDAAAIEDGRVFVGRKRVRAASERVRPGDEVVVAPPRPRAEAVTILARSRDLVVADKPAGMPTIPDQTGGAHSLVAAVARAVGVAPARLHATSRLDRDVSGAVTFALDPRAAERLKQARARGDYDRRYVAISVRPPSPAAGEWDAPIGRAPDPRRRAAFGRDAAAARTRYAVVATAASRALLAVAPVTGRTHQIRVHAAHAGAPLLGDVAYGGPARETLASGKVLPLRRVALHCARISVPRDDGALLVVVSPVPAGIADLWVSIGGEPSAWDIAVSCPLGASSSS
jgi:RluA family pseudouridine synthase